MILRIGFTRSDGFVSSERNNRTVFTLPSDIPIYAQPVVDGNGLAWAWANRDLVPAAGKLDACLNIDSTFRYLELANLHDGCRYTSDGLDSPINSASYRTLIGNLCTVLSVS